MTASTALEPVAARGATVRVTFPRLVRSELIKLRSLRAILGGAALLVACTVGLAGLVGLTARSEGNGAVSDLATTMTLVTGQLIVQTLAVILGCLAATIEYSSGSIRVTLTAAPRRWSLLGAKTVAVALVLAVVVTLAVGLAFVTLFAIFLRRGFGVVVGPPDVTALAGLVGYGVILGLLGFLLGFVTRSVVGGIGASLGLTLILPLLMGAGSGQAWVRQLLTIMPEHAAHRLFVGHGAADVGSGLAIALAWLAVGFIVTGVLFARRDA